jgi:hypothetical protein
MVDYSLTHPTWSELCAELQAAAGDLTLVQELIASAEPISHMLIHLLGEGINGISAVLPHAWLDRCPLLEELPEALSTPIVSLAELLLETYATDQMKKIQEGNIFTKIRRTDHGLSVQGSAPKRKKRDAPDALLPPAPDYTISFDAKLGCPICKCKDFWLGTGRAGGGYMCKHLRSVWALTLAEISLTATATALWRGEQVQLSTPVGMLVVDPAEGVLLPEDIAVYA